MATDPSEILAQGVEIEDGVSVKLEPDLLDERAVQCLNSQVDDALPGRRKLVDRADKVATHVAGLVPNSLRRIATPELQVSPRARG